MIRLILLLMLLVPQVCWGADKFMHTALLWNTNSNLAQDYCDVVANYDIVWTTRLNAKTNAGDWCGSYWPCVWDYLHNKNPDLKVFVYITPLEVATDHDTYSVRALNDLGRYQNARGHSMGYIDQHPGFYLYDENGTRLTRTDAEPNWLQLDGGNSTFRTYLKEVLVTDIIEQETYKYKSNGICFDNCGMVYTGKRRYSVKYSTEDLWGDMMISFMSEMASFLHNKGQLLWTNSGTPRTENGYNNWMKWAQAENINYPDYILEEGGVCAYYGPWDIQFYSGADWKRSIDAQFALAQKTGVVISNPLGSYWIDNTTGSDNFGDSVTRDDIFQYIFGSWALARTDNLHLSVYYTNGTTPYFEFMEAANNGRLNLGKPLAPYYIKQISGVNLYVREFSEGFVVVNPTGTNVTTPFKLADLGIKEPCKRVDIADLGKPYPTQPIATLTLPRHRALILRKTKDSQMIDVGASRIDAETD